MSLMFKISYGLYVLSTEFEGKNNGCMINTFAQQTSNPEVLSITVNKLNYTNELIQKSGKCAVSILSKDTTFDVIKNFGMQSGKTVDKFDGIKAEVTNSGIKVPGASNGVLGYFDLEVINSIDLGTHTLFLLKSVENKIFKDGEPLTYAYYQSNIKPKPVKVEDNGKEKWVCKVCGYVHEGPLPKDFVCPICKHPASDFEKMKAAEENKENNINKENKNMKKFVCPVCGYVYEGEEAPEKCPQCGVPGAKFKVQEGDLSWAAEHVIGVGKGVPQDIYEGLKANFEGECTEVGMYLAMARAAHREGYPEIGLYWEKAAWEEAEHAAKFCEMLGELVSESTKINLQKRVEAENGATAGKTELAKRAKEEGLDAIHDTVHEMARDEARHGKALKGLLDRYFK